MSIKGKRYFKFIIIVFFAVVFYFFYYNYVHSKLIELTNLYASDKLDFVAQAVENNRTSKINEVEIISDINFKYKDNNIDYNEIMSLIKESIVCESIFIGDLNGKCVSDNNNVMYMQEYDYYINACEGVTGMSEPLYSYNDKKWVTAVASPIRDDKGKIQKILVVFFDAGYLRELILGIDFGEGTTTFITTNNKVIVASNSEIISKNITKTGTIPENNSKLDIIKAMQDKAIETLFGEEKFVYDGENIHTFFRTLNDANWILVTAVPERFLYEDIYALNSVIMAFTLFAVFSAAIFLIRSSRLNISLKNERKKRDFVISSSNIVTIKLNFNGGIIDCNDNFINITNFKKQNLKGMSIYNIIPDEYYQAFDIYLENVLSFDFYSEQLDMPVINNGGNNVYILWSADINEEFNYVEFVGTNISNLKDYEKKIQRLAYFDQITGLNNFVYLEEYFNNVTITNKFASGSAFIYIDVDNFKYINDMFGHNMGDAFIVDLSKRILDIGNSKIKICKRGGDEFVIFYENPEKDNELGDYIERVFKVIKEEYYINNVKMNISVSMGISVYPDDGVTYTELFKCADIALQAAKEEGKNRFKYFNNSMKNELYEIITIENNLKSAIENNEFVLYYQPQYAIDTGELYGFEALIRWHSPNQGFVQPNKFIPHAEQNQLIIPIGKFAFETTCDFIRELVKKGFDDLCISVNISVVQMMCDDFVEFIIGTIEKKGINPKNIKLEITESVLIKSVEDAVNKINVLNQYGIRFALDDFGTGYSSLSYLKKISFDVLKIDKSFTDSILDKNNNKEILSIIIKLAQDINIGTIAEGVEEYEQLEWLKSRGCDVAQGFYMGKPMPKEKVFEILGKNMYALTEENS